MKQKYSQFRVWSKRKGPGHRIEVQLAKDVEDA